MTKFYNKLSKIFFFIFFFLLAPSKQLFAETIIGAKLEKFIIENTISYVEPNGHYIKIKFDDNPKLYTFEVYYSQRSEQKISTHRDSWNFVNSKTAVYLGESKAPNNDLILSNVTFQIDDKFINFTKESIRWQAQYSFVNREIEWQKQAEIRKQEEIKKEQDRIKAEQLKKEAEAKAAVVKKQAEERAATAKKEAEERYARLEKEAQEKDRREAIINGIKLIAILSVITGLSFYLYKFQKNKIKQLFSMPIVRNVSIFLIIFLAILLYPKKKIDVYDLKNRFYYDDNFRIMATAAWQTCGQTAMGKSKMLDYSGETIVPCDSKYLNCNIMGPTVKLCFWGQQ